jgi:hypothetical protein
MEPTEMLAKLEELQNQIAEFYQMMLEATKGGHNVTMKKYEETGSEAPAPRTPPPTEVEEPDAPEMQSAQSTGGRAISPEDFMNMKKKI